MTQPVDFSGGLLLLDADTRHVNVASGAQRKVINGKLTEKLEFTCPKGTTFVHASFRTVDMCFGHFSNREARKLKSVYFEITNHDFSELANRKFTCEVYAQLESESPDDGWTPYFIVEALFFGHADKPS